MAETVESGDGNVVGMALAGAADRCQGRFPVRQSASDTRESGFRGRKPL